MNCFRILTLGHPYENFPITANYKQLVSDVEASKLYFLGKFEGIRHMSVLVGLLKIFLLLLEAVEAGQPPVEAAQQPRRPLLPGADDKGIVIEGVRGKLSSCAPYQDITIPYNSLMHYKIMYVVIKLCLGGELLDRILAWGRSTLKRTQRSTYMPYWTSGSRKQSGHLVEAEGWDHQLGRKGKKKEVGFCILRPNLSWEGVAL